MRVSRISFLMPLAALLVMQAGAAVAQTAPTAMAVAAPQTTPRLDLSVLAVGSWRPNDNLRIRIWARGFEPAPGQQVALIVDGQRISIHSFDGRAADGTAYADFSLPWRGLERTTMTAEMVADVPTHMAAAGQTGEAAVFARD